jgi:alpha-D-xyloside xylohydrolase
MNFTLTGMPYWTTDIGGFFRPGNAQYTDKNYHELLTRWFQWGAFSTIFRIHGYQSETEPWKYGTQVEDNMRKMLNLRYKLMPYIYSEAWKIHNGSTMMRPMVMDFQNDKEAVNQAYQYMFGSSFLVAPITASNTTEWEVYLPKNSKWYNFWSGNSFDGGQKVKVDAPLNQIPLFVKAGAILPMGEKVQYTNEKKWDHLEIRVYEGADGKFTLYEDEGDNYNYENGKQSTIEFNWDDDRQILTIYNSQGEFNAMLKTRKFEIIKVSKNENKGKEKPYKVVTYNGDKISIQL